MKFSMSDINILRDRAFSVAGLIWVLAFGQVESFAQAGPTPTPSIPGNGIADTFARLAIEAHKQLAEATTRIDQSFSGMIFYIASGIAMTLIVLSAARLISDDDGNPLRPVFLFIRVLICLALFTQINPILNGFEQAKQDVLDSFKIMQAVDKNGNLEKVTPTQNARLEFDMVYRKFSDVYFKEVATTQSPDDKKNETSGKLWDPDKPWQTNIDNAVNPNLWNAPRLFATLTIFRGILSFSDFTVEIIYGLVRLAFILFAPIMCAVAIDRQLFNQVTLPYLKGLVVFYLVWPVVADVIRMLSYLFSATTIKAFMFPTVQTTLDQGVNGPVLVDHITFNAYGVIAACIIMLVCSLSLLASPALSYKISMGQVFESVSSSVAMWIGSIAGQAAELYGAKVSADLENMARMTEIRAGRDASYALAEARRDAGELSVQSHLLGNRAQNVTSYRSISTGLDAENMRANQMIVANNGLSTNLALSATETNVARTVQGAQFGKENAYIDMQRAKAATLIDQHFAQTGIVTSSSIDIVNSIAGGEVGTRSTGEASLLQGGINAVGIAGKGYFNYQIAGDRAKEQLFVADSLNRNQNIVIDRNAQSNIEITEAEFDRNVMAYNAYSDVSMASNTEYAGRMQDVARTNFNELDSTYTQIAELGRQGNTTVFNADIKAADIHFEASRRAADLHWNAQFIGAATRDIDRTLQEALSLNY
jgi:hypothetical protein